MEANEITVYRLNVQKVFADRLGVRIVPGLMDGPNQSMDWLGSLYLSRVQENPARITEQQIYMTLRVFAPFSSAGTLSPNEPYDPAPLEEMAGKILAVIAANQIGLGAWFQRVIQIEIDPVAQGVQATLLGTSDNPGIAS